MDHFTSLCMVLFEFLKDISLPNTVELMGMYGRMVINSFTILDIDMNSIGTGIYLASSIVDHSCDPNAVATFDGNIINIRAIQDMPNLDWNQVNNNSI
ncbi:SET and MYND domain-containing protein 3 [Papilio machaon]|uniref:SET and MYND domain-containing protein 3 n=1 Tax=Papilio machaon TaxID=76193 RepID=A0A0N1IEE7_PAPMA|nr:SET and MYND domain-containing protein 3 [Papilio machaon]